MDILSVQAQQKVDPRLVCLMDFLFVEGVDADREPFRFEARHDLFHVVGRPPWRTSDVDDVRTTRLVILGLVQDLVVGEEGGVIDLREDLNGVLAIPLTLALDPEVIGDVAQIPRTLLDMDA